MAIEDGIIRAAAPVAGRNCHTRLDRVSKCMEDTMRAAIALMIVLATAAATGQTKRDSWHGTWTLSVAKSTYNASPAPRSGTSRLTPAPGGAMHLVQDQITADGTARHIETTTPFDGKDHPVESLPGVTYALTRVNDFIYVLLAKEQGAVTSTTMTVVSSDGSTRTSTTVVVNAAGRTVANIAVYDRAR
jgi:hypothetical protein